MAKYTPLSLITLNVSGLDTPSKYIDQVQHKTSFNKFKKIEISPGWCGSVDQAPACKPDADSVQWVPYVVDETNKFTRTA